MAFFGRIGNLLRQTASRQVSSELRSSPSFFQAIRCLSSAPSSKLFIGGAFDLPFELMPFMLLILCLVDSDGLCIGCLSVSGVSFSTDEQSLREAFSKYGEVVDGK